MKKVIVIAAALIMLTAGNAFSGGKAEKDGQTYFVSNYGSLFLQMIIEEGFSSEFTEFIKLSGCEQAFDGENFRFGLLGAALASRTVRGGDTMEFIVFSPEDSDISGTDISGLDKQEIEEFLQEREESEETLNAAFTGISPANVKRGTFYWLYGLLKYEGSQHLIEIKYIEPYFQESAESTTLP